MTPAQSDSLLMRTKASSIRFDERSNKIVVDIINDSGNHIEIADSGINQKLSSFKKGNDNETNTTITADNLTPKPILRSSQEILKQRASLLDSLMRLSSTMDALPAALTSVSRKAFHRSDLASKHNSEEDSRPLLRSYPTDDDNNTLLFELNRRTPIRGCSSIKGEMTQKPPTAALKDVQRSEESAEKGAFNGKCDETNSSMQYAQRSSISSTQSPNYVTISEESTNDFVSL
uniref:Uncharacterized protein n=1 Tax=Ascaris lumbricoides TaxID=6252 RepID=A0A0M3I1P0_ASCLU